MEGAGENNSNQINNDISRNSNKMSKGEIDCVASNLPATQLARKRETKALSKASNF